MKIEYLISLADEKQLPDLIKGQYIQGFPHRRICFFGRSNVGKSTLLNSLTQSKVARTSKQPGKTRAIHFFNSEWKTGVDTFQRIWVDLPGYGFAKRSQDQKENWKELIEQYLRWDSKNIGRVFLLWDSRHGPSDSDLECMRYIQKFIIPFAIVMTKSDTIKTQSDRARRKKEIEKISLDLGSPPVFWVHHKDSRGIEALLGLMEKEEA